MIGLVLASGLVVIDTHKIIVTPGLWLKNNHGPDVVIVLIFFLSGLALDTRQIKEGFADVKGTLLALSIIFIIAPFTGYFFSFLPLEAGLIIGLLLVASMPTTLSSGVVMTGSAGGNMAHSLLITIVANSIAVFSIPVTLSLLLGTDNNGSSIHIERLPMMIKIGTLVLIPLVAGLLLRRLLSKQLQPFLPYTSTCNQIGILSIVTMALCSSRPAILSGLNSIIAVILIVFFFHLVLVIAALLLTNWFKVPKGKRESVIFMGGQKTLPLSIILQVSLFPELGLALVVCVVHHIVHLIMDAYLIGYLKSREN